MVLKDVHVQTAAKVGVPSGWRAAISAVDDPLLLIHLGEPRIAELTFDIHHSDLPLRAAFPILVQNLLNYLLPSGFENQSYPTGRPVTLAAEPDARSLELVEPSGRVVKLGPPFPAAPFTETEAPGIYTVRQQLASGQRVSSFVVQFQDPDLFTGEHVSGWMFEDHGALRPLREASEILAQREWPRLYDPDQLARNHVPVAAAIYVNDMYVPRELSEDTAGRIGGMRAWITNEYEHNGLRADGGRILGRLIDLARGRA